MADVKILEKARTSFFQDDDLIFINQNNALRQVPAAILAEKIGGIVPAATEEKAGLMTAQDKTNLELLQEHHNGGIIPAYKLDYAGRTAAGVAADLLTYIEQIPGGGTRKLNIGVGNISAFVGYWNSNDDTTVLLAGEWSALDIIGVCRDNEKIYAKLRLTNYNNNKTYESILKASVFSPWAEMVNSETMAKYSAIPGEFKWYAGSSVPGGYLLCNGALINRETYKDLFAAIGTTYGAGDGSTTFALPNLIDRVVQGAATAGTYKEAGLPNVEGEITNSSGYGIFDNRATYEYIPSGAFYKTQTSQTANYQAASCPACNFGIDASKSNSIYGNSTTVQPPALTMLPIIKY